MISNSPPSLLAIRKSGNNNNNIYYNKKENLFNSFNQKSKSQFQRLESEQFMNKENYRNKLLEKSQSQPNFLSKNKYNINYFQSSTPYSQYFGKRIISGIKNLKNGKSVTDFWSLRYDKGKEDEQIYFLKKQNFSHIKKLIDDTLKLREKGKYENHKKYVKKEEEKILIQKEYLAKRDNDIIHREKIEKEADEKNKKIKEKEFMEKCLKLKKKEEFKEKKMLEQQEKMRLRQQEWESKNQEHLSKVENMYEKKHNSAVNEYFQILKKGLERDEKIEERKNEFNLKNQLLNKNRYTIYINYKNKTKEEIAEIKKKLEQKHRNISEFYSMQKELKKNLMESQKKRREEKVISNIYQRIANKNKEFERRKKLLDLFEKNEEKIEKRLLLKEKKHEEFIVNNLIKSEEMSENYLRNKKKLRNKLKLKMQKMKNKDDEVNNKILIRQNSARVRIARYDEVKANKDIILQHAKQVLEERKEYKPKDVYEKVFSDEQIHFIEES